MSVTCPICKGKGQVEVMSSTDTMDKYQQTCLKCDGTGKIRATAGSKNGSKRLR